MSLETTSITVTKPSWLPPGLQAQLALEGRIEITTGFTRAEKKVLRKRKKIPASAWAERHRMLTAGPLPGPWKNEATPYLAGIMDAAFFSSVQTIIVCAAPQTGKSESVHNCIGYVIDRAPGPVLYVYPDRDTSRENCNDRIQPMIESSPRLRSYLTGVDDDVSSMRVNLSHMPIYLAWARSAARLANKPIRYVVFDECDKYPETAGKKEADPISLGEKRTTTYRWNRKIWKISTPTIETGPIWLALTTEAQAVFDYHVKCPACGVLHLMTFEQIKWPEGERDPERVVSKGLAWYECPHCDQHWGDAERDRAVRAGEWRERESGRELFDYLQAQRPRKIGFHLPSWLSFFVSLNEPAAAFLRGLKNKSKLKDFLNAHKAEPWRDYTVERSEDAILNLADERPRGLVPAGGSVAGLTGAADTQANGFYYEIRAWAYGLTRESWQVREGFAPTFKALEQIMFDDEYRDADGRKYVVQMLVIDAMGGVARETLGEGTRTSEVYDFCCLHRGRSFPLKGEQRMNAPFAYSKLETYPGTNKPIPGGLQLLRANTTFFKNRLSNILEISPADPGAWHLHSETPFEWARQMTAEYVDEKGLWQCMSGRANHAWDVSVYNLVAAEIIGLRFWKQKPPPNAVAPPKSKRRVLNRGIHI